MEENTLLEKIKQAQNDKEKMDIIQFIQDENIKVEAIYLLESDNNKLSIVENLRNENTKAKIYKKLIANDEITDTIIAEVLKFDNPTRTLHVLDQISNIEKKTNVLANLFINYKDPDEELRRNIFRKLNSIYKDIQKEHRAYTFLDFLNTIKNDYAIACVIANSKFEINDKKIFLQAIKDNNIREDIGLLYSSRAELITKFNTNNISVLNLPQDMTIGVELEAEGKTASALNGLKICDNWQAVSDISLEQGIEVVSPILYDSLEDMTDLAMICQIMKQCKLDVSNRCGGHIHIGANYLDSKEALENFLMLWLGNEESIYKMCNSSEKAYREGITEHAKPITYLYNDLDEKVFSNISNAQTRNELVKIFKNIHKGKNNGLNLDNINSEEKNTIEFRISNGTLDFKEIQNNIRLYGRLMQRSKEVSLLQAKTQSGQELSQIEQQKIEDFESLCNQQNIIEEKGQKLIEFLFEENERNTYISRYNSSRRNSEKLIFNNDAYKKLYKALKLKDKNFSDTIVSLKDSKTSEKEDEEIEQ